MAKCGGAGWRWRGAGTLPRVRPQVVVVAAGSEERCLRPELSHQCEAEYVSVERDRLRNRGDFQMDMPHHGCRRQLAKGLRGRVEFAEDVLDVERKGRHPRADLSFPDLSRAVPVNLDAVPVRVAQVERFADEMIGCPDERNAILRRMVDPAREMPALGEEQRKVVEARVAVRGLGARFLDEHEQLSPFNSKTCKSAAVLE